MRLLASVEAAAQSERDQQSAWKSQLLQDVIWMKEVMFFQYISYVYFRSQFLQVYINVVPLIIR